MKESKAIIIKSEYGEALYINNKLIKEGHNLHEGQDRIKYIRKASINYKFDIFKLQFGYVTDDYNEYLYSVDEFHDDLEDVGYILENIPD